MPTSYAADATVSRAELDVHRALLERQWRARLDRVTRLALELADAHERQDGPARGSAHDLAAVLHELLVAARAQLEETEEALRRLDQT